MRYPQPQPEVIAKELFVGIKRPGRVANTIAAIAIVNQKPWGPPIPRAAFDDLLRCPLGRRMPRNFDVEDLSIGKPDHAEDVERLE
jgi:hypothetical protein